MSFTVWYFILKGTPEQLQVEIISCKHSSQNLKGTPEQLQVEIISYKHSSQNLIMIIISLNLHLFFNLGLFLTKKCAVFLQTSECDSIWSKVTFPFWNTKPKCPYWFCHWINSKSSEIPHQAPSGQSGTPEQ